MSTDHSMRLKRQDCLQSAISARSFAVTLGSTHLRPGSYVPVLEDELNDHMVRKESPLTR